jgi:hypothetical protein
VPLPENFGSLHQYEEKLRQESTAAIEASPDLMRHAEAIESAMNTLNHFTHGYPQKEAMGSRCVGMCLSSDPRCHCRSGSGPSEGHGRDILQGGLDLQLLGRNLGDLRRKPLEVLKKRAEISN